MAEKTAGRRRHSLLQSYLVVGFFALLGFGEIIFVVTGVQKLEDPRDWLVFATSMLIVGVFIFMLVGNVAGLVILKLRGPTHTISSSLFETNLDGFDAWYEQLLRHINMLPDTGRKTDENQKERLVEIANAFKEIKDKLMQMSGTHPYKEDLLELERQLTLQSFELLHIGNTSGSLWTRLRTRGTGFCQEYRKVLNETSELEMLLVKTLERAKKKEKATK